LGDWGYFSVTTLRRGGEATRGLRPRGLSDIVEKIIPFFNKYQLEGAKALDFADFCKVAELMKNKDHLNQVGLEQIRKIKVGMNTGRQNVVYNSTD
jgi:hypothetical protein